MDFDFQRHDYMLIRLLHTLVLGKKRKEFEHIVMQDV